MALVMYVEDQDGKKTYVSQLYCHTIGTSVDPKRAYDFTHSRREAITFARELLYETKSPSVRRFHLEEA